MYNELFQNENPYFMHKGCKINLKGKPRIDPWFLPGNPCYVDAFGMDEEGREYMLSWEVVTAIDPHATNEEIERIALLPDTCDWRNPVVKMFNQKALENIMTVEEAAEEWGLAPGTVKNYCAQGKVQAKKVGRDWAIDRNQPNPRQKA
ncbi:helix-turn-helix domain-containing protein [Paenibacillus alvei]|nr:helix-turn-helix domain-containing protein [Paenibacillus alvei]EJW14743.1 hypothetical protein PAV_11c00840 [Paenibacillus alvei DSM 29]